MPQPESARYRVPMPGSRHQDPASSMCLRATPVNWDAQVGSSVNGTSPIPFATRH